MARVIRMDLGEVAWAPPREAIVAAMGEAAAGRARYAPPAGLSAVREALATFLAARGRAVQPEQVVLTTGASGALAAVLASLADRGPEVLVPDPGYPGYAALARALGLRVRHYPLRPDCGWGPDLLEVARLLGPATRVLVVTQPSNPTGALIPLADLLQLLRLAADAGVPVVIDEAYAELHYEKAPALVDAAQVLGSVYSVLSFSKAFALSGWRIGAAIVPHDRAGAVSRAQYGLVMGAPTPAQHALEACLSVAGTYLPALRRHLWQARDRAMDTLRGLPLAVFTPGAGPFLWTRAFAVDGDQMAQHLSELGVLVAPGQAFGPGSSAYFRMMFDVPAADLAEVAARVVTAQAMCSKAARKPR